MNTDKHLSQESDLSQLRQLIVQKWPEAVAPKTGLSEPIFHTGVPGLDALFPRQGIPYGQLIEITGATGCGKTSLLFMLLAALTKNDTVAYIDHSGSFFPNAAVSYGVDAGKLSVIKPDNFVIGLRSAELLLSHQMVDHAVIDLTSTQHDTKKIHLLKRDSSPQPTLLHRLRQQVVRSKALMIFLTDNSNQTMQSLPASMVALRLDVSRLIPSRINITITKSRISPESAHAEVLLNE